MKKRIVSLILCMIIVLTSCGNNVVQEKEDNISDKSNGIIDEEVTVNSIEKTTMATVETTTESTTEKTTELTTETTTEVLTESSTTEYGDKVEYIKNEYGTISRYTIKRDEWDQVEDIMDFDTPVEVINNDNVAIYIMQISYTHTASGEVYVGFWFTAKNNSDSEYIDVIPKNESVGEQMIDFSHGSGGGLISPGKKSEWIGQESDALSEDIVTSIDDMFELEGTIQCTFFKDTNSYSDRDENYDFSLKDCLSK